MKNIDNPEGLPANTDPGVACITPLTQAQTEDMVNLIRQYLDHYEEAGSVLAASFRRLGHFYDTYHEHGCVYLVMAEDANGPPIGGVGLGPMASLPSSEGIGEIRELVLAKQFRRRGLGGVLLSAALKEAEKLGYRRLYLETTPEMSHARRLFERCGFRPIIDKNQGLEDQTAGEHLPCYYMRDIDEEG